MKNIVKKGLSHKSLAFYYTIQTKYQTNSMSFASSTYCNMSFLSMLHWLKDRLM